MGVHGDHPCKMLYPLICLVLLGAAHCSGPLPEYMIGEYELETSEGFNNYMYAVGVDWFTRKIACSLYPKAKNAQSGQDVTISTESTFKSTSVTFKLDTPFQENTADGRTVTTIARLSSIETRRFLDGGNKMMLIHTLPSDNTMQSVRGYRELVRYRLDMELCLFIHSNKH